MLTFVKDWFSLDGDSCKMFREQTYEMKVEGVSLLERFSSRRHSVGSLFLTPTHLIYVDHENKRETWVLHSHICSALKMGLFTSGAPLQVRTKHFLSLTFVLPKERDAHELSTKLNQMCQPEHLESLYCFSYKMDSEELSRETGWSLFKLNSDFERMDVPNDCWVLTNMNKNYELCDTYPEELYVPVLATTAVLLGTSKFRSRGRFPVLTYLHHNKAALCRCSQPLSGFSARCVEDEAMLTAIRKVNNNSEELLVVDTRPRINAFANRAAGKGYESQANYENTKFLFAPIDNIHVMRSSLSRLLERCELKDGVMNYFLSGVDSSGWLKHIKATLDAAYAIALKLEEGVSVLVHCSDGWDRTAQVCGLAQLMLDPYYRTIHGFQALIAKEWLAFGHKFTDRCGHIQGDAREVSPIFTQWLDCVWQLLSQEPALFQFNSSLLLLIHDHSFSCQFGTFVGNCVKDRVDLRLAERTYSLWGYIANHINEYLNPSYKPHTNIGFVQFNLAPQNIRLWSEMYCRWETGLHPRESLNELMKASKDHITSLEDHIRLLQSVVPKCPSPSDPLVIDNKDIENNSSSLQSSLLKKLYIDQVNIKVQQTLPGGEKLGSKDFQDILEKLDGQLSSVAVDWKSSRGLTQCSCSTPLDFATNKSHCWRCGDIFCSRCLKKCIRLPGHFSLKDVPVCHACYNIVMRDNSVDSFTEYSN